MLQKLREEQASRLLFERSVREEMEKRWQSLKAYIDEEAHSTRQSEKVSSWTVSKRSMHLSGNFNLYSHDFLFCK